MSRTSRARRYDKHSSYSLPHQIFRRHYHQKKRSHDGFSSSTEGSSQNNDDEGLLSKVKPSHVIVGGKILFALGVSIYGCYYLAKNSEDDFIEVVKKKLNLKKNNNVPAEAPHPVLRKSALEKIRAKFLSNYLNFESSDLQDPIVAIVGEPLQGKTELAKQYAHQYRNHHHHIFFVPKEHWEKAYRDFAEAWSLFPDKEVSDCPIDLVIKKVHEVLSRRSLRRSLVIFDDIDASFFTNCLKGQLPQNTQILLTTRDSDATWESFIDLSKDDDCILTHQEGLDILSSWTDFKDFEREAAEKIVTRFRNAPLAIAQAGRAISEYQIPMENYLLLLDANKKIVSATIQPNDPTYDTKINTWASILIDVKELEKKNTRALDLLFLCALFPSRTIPRDLLKKIEGLDSEDLETLLNLLENIIQKNNKHILIHELFQKILVEEAKDKSKQLLSKIAHHYSPKYDPFFLEIPTRSIEVFKQGLEDKNKHQLNELQLGDLYAALGMAYQKNKNYELALPSYKKCFDIRVKKLGDNHLATAFSLGKIGDCLLTMRDLAPALVRFKQALKIYKSHLDKTHPLVRASYNKIANCHLAYGDYKEALVAFYIASSKNLKKNLIHSDIWINIGNAALLSDNLELAKNSYKIASEIIKKNLGPTHVAIVSCYSGYGKVFLIEKEYERAFFHLDKAYMITAKTLGEMHIATAPILEDLGEYYFQIEKYDEAEIKFREALMRWENSDDPQVAFSYDGLGKCYRKKGFLEKALEEHFKGLNIRKHNLPSDHPELAYSYEEIAECYFHMQNYKEAKVFYEKAYRIRKYKLGKSHFLTKLSKKRLLDNLEQLGV